ncbi:hypothetical protein LguiA_036320 [Lonicera macranthoides]
MFTRSLRTECCTAYSVPRNRVKYSLLGPKEPNSSVDNSGGENATHVRDFLKLPEISLHLIVSSISLNFHQQVMADKAIPMLDGTLICVSVEDMAMVNFILWVCPNFWPPTIGAVCGKRLIGGVFLKRLVNKAIFKENLKQKAKRVRPCSAKAFKLTKDLFLTEGNRIRPCSAKASKLKKDHLQKKATAQGLARPRQQTYIYQRISATGTS